jgi:hypothetical protein
MISSLLYSFVAGLLCFFLVELQQELGRTERFNAFLRLGSGHPIFDQPLSFSDQTIKCHGTTMARINESNPLQKTE